MAILDLTMAKTKTWKADDLPIHPLIQRLDRDRLQIRTPEVQGSSDTTIDSTAIYSLSSVGERRKEFDWINNRDPVQRIIHLTELTSGWDGYGAPPFSRSCIVRGLTVYFKIRVFAEQNRLRKLAAQPFVAPCSDGEILLEWAGQAYPDKELELYVPQDGRQPLTYLKVEGDRDEEGEISDNEIGSLLRWLFLD